MKRPATAATGLARCLDARAATVVIDASVGIAPRDLLASIASCQREALIFDLSDPKMMLSRPLRGRIERAKPDRRSDVKVRV